MNGIQKNLEMADILSPSILLRCMVVIFIALRHVDCQGTSTTSVTCTENGCSGSQYITEPMNSSYVIRDSVSISSDENSSSQIKTTLLQSESQTVPYNEDSLPMASLHSSSSSSRSASIFISASDLTKGAQQILSHLESDVTYTGDLATEIGSLSEYIHFSKDNLVTSAGDQSHASSLSLVSTSSSSYSESTLMLQSQTWWLSNIESTVLTLSSEVINAYTDSNLAPSSSITLSSEESFSSNLVSSMTESFTDEERLTSLYTTETPPFAQTLSYLATMVGSAKAETSISGLVDASTEVSAVENGSTVVPVSEVGIVSSIITSVSSLLLESTPVALATMSDTVYVGDPETATGTILATAATVHFSNQPSLYQGTSSIAVTVQEAATPYAASSVTTQVNNVTIYDNDTVSSLPITSTLGLTSSLTSATTIAIIRQSTNTVTQAYSETYTIGDIDTSTISALSISETVTVFSNGTASSPSSMETTQMANDTTEELTTQPISNSNTATTGESLNTATTLRSQSTTEMLKPENTTTVNSESTTTVLSTATGYTTETDIQNATAMLSTETSSIQVTTERAYVTSEMLLPGATGESIGTTASLLETTEVMSNTTYLLTTTNVQPESTTVTGLFQSSSSVTLLSTFSLHTTMPSKQTTVAVLTSSSTLDTSWNTSMMATSPMTVQADSTPVVNNETMTTLMFATETTLYATPDAPTTTQTETTTHSGLETTQVDQNSNVTTATVDYATTVGSKNATVLTTLAATTVAMETTEISQNITNKPTTIIPSTLKATTVSLETTEISQNITNKPTTTVIFASFGTTEGTHNTTVTTTAATIFGMETTEEIQSTTMMPTASTSTDVLDTTEVMQNTTILLSTTTPSPGSTTTVETQNTNVTSSAATIPTAGLVTTEETTVTSLAVATPTAGLVRTEETTVTSSTVPTLKGTTEGPQNATIISLTDKTTSGVGTTDGLQNTAIVASTDTTTVGFETTEGMQNTTVAPLIAVTTSGIETTGQPQNTAIVLSTATTTGGLQTTDGTQNTTFIPLMNVTTSGIETTEKAQNTTTISSTIVTTVGLDTTEGMLNTTIVSSTATTAVGLQTTEGTQNTTVTPLMIETTSGIETTHKAQNTTTIASTIVTTVGLDMTEGMQNTTLTPLMNETTSGIETTEGPQNTTILLTTVTTTVSLETTDSEGTQNTTVTPLMNETTSGIETSEEPQNTTIVSSTAATTVGIETTKGLQNTTIVSSTTTAIIGFETTEGSQNTTVTPKTTTTLSTTVKKPTTTTLRTTTTELTTTVEEVTLNTTEELDQYWIKTVLSVPESVNVSTYEFRKEMETILAKLFFDAFKREEQAINNSITANNRGKRAVIYEDEGQNVTVQIVEVNRATNEPSNVDIIYFMEKDGLLVTAETAVNVLDFFSEQELALHYFNYLVITKAAVAVPPEVVVPEPPQYWIIGAVVGSLIGFILILWLILFIYYKCIKPPDPGKTPRTTRSSRRHSRQLQIGEPELIGVKKLGTANLANGKTNGFTQIDQEAIAQRSEASVSHLPPRKNYLDRKQGVKPPDIPPLDLNGIEQSPKEVVYANVNKQNRRPLPKKHRTPQRDEGGLASDTVTYVSEESRVPRRKQPPKKPSRKRSPRRSKQGKTSSLLQPSGEEDPPVTYRSSHQLKLPPISQKPIVGQSLYDQLQEQHKVEDTIRRKTDVERQRNKQRLRKRKGPNDPYLRVQAEIDAVLAGSEQELLPEPEKDRRHRRRKPPPKPKRRRGPYNHEEIELHEGIPPSTSDAGYTETETELDQPESLDDTRKKIHRLLDDAFALISPKHGNKVSPYTGPSRRPIPGASTRKRKQRVIRSTQTTPKQSDREETNSEHPEKLFELNPMWNTEGSKSSDAETLKSETIHTPMYFTSQPPTRAYANAVQNPYSIDDEVARLLPTKEPALVPPGGVNTSPMHSLKVGQMDEQRPVTETLNDSWVVPSHPAARALDGARVPYSSRRALIPDDYTSLRFGTEQLTPLSTRPRVPTPPFGGRARPRALTPPLGGRIENAGNMSNLNDSLLQSGSRSSAFQPLRSTLYDSQYPTLNTQDTNSSIIGGPDSSRLPPAYEALPGRGTQSHPFNNGSTVMNASSSQPSQSLTPYRHRGSIGGPIEDGQDEIDVISSTVKPGSSAQPLIKSIREELMRLTQRRTPVKEFDA